MELSSLNILEIIKREGDSSLSYDDLGEDEKFSDFGMDSLDLSAIYLGIEDEYNVRIPSEKISEVQTINAVIAYIKENS